MASKALVAVVVVVAILATFVGVGWLQYYTTSPNPVVSETLGDQASEGMSDESASGTEERPDENLQQTELVSYCKNCSIAPALGSKEILVLTVQFPGYEHDPDGLNVEYVAERLAKYYEANSYGKLYLNVTVSPKLYELPDSSAYDKQGDLAPNELFFNADEFVRDVFSIASDDYDLNEFDGVVIIKTGEWGGLALLEREWQVNQLTVNVPVAIVKEDLARFPGFASNIWENATIKTVQHETGHVFGLPDLYSWEFGDELFTWEKVPGAHEARIFSFLDGIDDLNTKLGPGYYKNATVTKSANELVIQNEENRLSFVLGQGGEGLLFVDLLANGEHFRSYPAKEEDGQTRVYTDALTQANFWEGMAGGQDKDAEAAPLSSWAKLKLGWVEEDNVLSVDPGEKKRVFIDPLGLESSGVMVVKLPITESHYYLVENREKVGSDATLNSVAGKGVLIMEVDEMQPGGYFGKPVVRWAYSDPQARDLNKMVFPVGPTYSIPDVGSIKVLSNIGDRFELEVDRSGVNLDTQALPKFTNEAYNGIQNIEVEISTNSTISEFYLSTYSRGLSIRLTGEAGTQGVLAIPIGKLLEGPYTVDTSLGTTPDVWSFRNADDELMLVLSYPNKYHEISIVGTRIVT